MDIQRWGVKLFVQNPEAANIQSFVPVFHRWIQGQAIAGHLLIDVHNYSHIPTGPGVLLVGHQGNFCADQVENRLGLFYYRKHAKEGSAQEKLSSVIRTGLEACQRLEADPDLKGLKFRGDEIQLVANDRLLATNTPETFDAQKPMLSAVLGKLFDGAGYGMQQNPDPKERFTVTARSGQPAEIKTLLARLSS